MSRVCRDLAVTVHFVVAMENTTNQQYMYLTNNEQNKTFLLNQNLTCA